MTNIFGFKFKIYSKLYYILPDFLTKYLFMEAQQFLDYIEKVRKDKYGLFLIECSKVKELPKEVTKLQDVKMLQFMNGKIPNPQYLVNLKNINIVRFLMIELQDLSFLNSFNKLATLEFSHVKNLDFEKIEPLPQLERLILQVSQVEHLDFLDKFPNLEILCIHEEKNYNLEPILKLSKLRKLYIRQTKLDYKNLKKLDGLTNLSAHRSKITETKFLNGFKNLEDLSLVDN